MTTLSNKLRGVFTYNSILAYIGSYTEVLDKLEEHIKNKNITCIKIHQFVKCDIHNNHSVLLTLHSGNHEYMVILSAQRGENRWFISYSKTRISQTLIKYHKILQNVARLEVPEWL